MMQPCSVDRRVSCYDFEITKKDSVDLSETVAILLKEQGYSYATCNQASLLSEEILLLIKEKNPPGKRIFAECNVIFEEDGIRLIFRDSGKIFDVMDTDGTKSLRDYVVSQLLCLPDYKVYLTTIGYNRNEF